ncbi:MAG: MAPEG family protein [Polyangiaceae bacterium]
MTNLASQPAFVAYVVSILVLSLNLLLLWAYSGSVRGKTKTTPNTEDASTIARGAQLVESDPPEVARVLRAHKNAMANIVPFAILGLVYVLAGGSALVAEIIFGVFTASRLAHTFAYLSGKQPWRSLSFGLGGAATLALMGFIVRAIVAA